MTTDLGMPTHGGSASVDPRKDARPGTADVPRLPGDQSLTKKDFTSDQEVRWCPGCGDYAILAAVQGFLPELGLKRDRSKFGYVCVRDMSLRTAEEVVDQETGEVLPVFATVLPTDFMCPQTGALLPVENPEIWVDQDRGDA